MGGEGFTNFGDVQFMADANLERYLEAAKKIADHAVIGAGPLQFFDDPGKSGFELSAISRINAIYRANGFRANSGEGGKPYGLDRYTKAFLRCVAVSEPGGARRAESDTCSDRGPRRCKHTVRAAHLVGAPSDPRRRTPSPRSSRKWQEVCRLRRAATVSKASTAARAGSEEVMLSGGQLAAMALRRRRGSRGRPR